MNTLDIQYITDSKGMTKAVIVPIDIWKKISSEDETEYLNKSPLMVKRILEAAKRDYGYTIEEVREKIRV